MPTEWVYKRLNALNDCRVAIPQLGEAVSGGGWGRWEVRKERV